MLDNTMLQALNERLNIERYNAAVYDMLASSLDVAYWPGSSSWMRTHANEETEHARKVADYIVDRGGVPNFGNVSEVLMINSEDLSVSFQAAFTLEQQNTESIKMLFYLADEQNDPQTHQFCMWLLEEQTSAEGELGNYLTMLKRLDANGKMVFDAEFLK